MWTFLLRRALATPPLLLGVALITFLLLRLSPGDFFHQMEMDPSISYSALLDQKAVAGLIKEIEWDKLDDGNGFLIAGARWRKTENGFRKDDAELTLREGVTSLKKFQVDGTAYYCSDDARLYRKIGGVEGFFRWIGKACVGDFGVSFKWKQPVFDLIVDRLWNTLTLSLCALFLAWGLAIPLGVLAAVRPNTVPDYICSLIAFLGLSIPSVFFALLMILFASYSGLFPIGDMRDLEYENLSTMGKIWDRIHHLILPTIVIGTPSIAQYMRQTRGNMVETLSQDYVRTARAKGLAPRKVLFKHALRNAINPLVTLFGYSLAALLSGSFLVEVVMNWPGMARLVYDALFAKDEPVAMAAVLFSALLLVVGNLIADVLLAIVDPRVRLS